MGLHLEVDADVDLEVDADLDADLDANVDEGANPVDGPAACSCLFAIFWTFLDHKQGTNHHW